MPLVRTQDGQLAVVGSAHGSQAAEDLWARLLFFCDARGLPAPEREYQVVSDRRWRFDFAWPGPARQVAIELDGGTWAKGRHTRGMGYERDCWKLSTAAACGWRVLRFTPRMVRDQWDGCAELLAIALTGAR